MRSMLWIALAVLAASACKEAPAPTPRTAPSGPDAPTASTDPSTALPGRIVEARCDVPEDARHLVLSVHRDVIPIGWPITREEAQVTADGPCEPATECAHVGVSTLLGLAALVRKASPIHHREAPTSPHYGFRSVTARWDGATCTLADGVNLPIVDADSRAFYDAFEAIAGAAVDARPGARDR